MPQIDTSVALFGCLGTCAAYAVLLSTKGGRAFTVRHTWVTVVAGVVLVLGWLALVDIDAALLAMAFFVAGGAPMIVRSWWLEVSYRNEYTELRRQEDLREQRRGEDYN